MARVDVFAKANKRGKREFYLVPIYPHQVADRVGWPAPPNRAVVGGKIEAEWTLVDCSFQFLFSVTQNSLIEMTKPDDEIVFGYFKGVDRSTAAIHVARHKNPRDLIRSTGSKTLLNFRKLAVDRLGNRTVIESEVRTWHGEACT